MRFPRLKNWSALLGTLVVLGGCAAPQHASKDAQVVPAARALSCDDSMKTGFKPDENTTVILVKAFRQGELLTLPGGSAVPAPQGGPPGSPPPTAPLDLCFVKLLVGPGSPGSAGAPSTSAGIGIEVWLPATAVWNERIRNVGGGGWAGGDHTSTTQIGDAYAALSTATGYVVGTTDAGHAVRGGSFAVREDGSINRELWHDFADRGLIELAIKTKALARAYYQKPHKFAYWEGCSTGGRQGFKMAQKHPEQYDGYLNGAPAINWTRFITAELYPQIVMQRDLQGVIHTDKLNFVSAAAVSACDVVGGRHLGFVLDPANCNYDPARDSSVLCKGAKGNGVTGSSTHAACVTVTEAQAINKIWYGQTVSGTAPDPRLDNASVPTLAGGDHLWWGLERGTSLALLAGAPTTPPFFGPFPIATDLVALELQDRSYAAPSFVNALGNGANRWTELEYADLARASRLGVELQPAFGDINTDDQDLSGVRKRRAKIVSYHGLADQLIPVEGSTNYFTRVSEAMGGDAATQEFLRLYLVPGMGHCAGVGSVSGTSSPSASPETVPLPAPSQFFDALVNWVEQGQAPDTMVLGSSNNTVSLPACVYPKKVAYTGTGAITSADSYACKSEP